MIFGETKMSLEIANDQLWPMYILYIYIYIDVHGDDSFWQFSFLSSISV